MGKKRPALLCKQSGCLTSRLTAPLPCNCGRHNANSTMRVQQMGCVTLHTLVTHTSCGNNTMPPMSCTSKPSCCLCMYRTVNIHLINTLGVEDVASCIECRCPPELELKNGGGVLCCSDCPSVSTRGVIEYAMEYTTIYRYAHSKVLS